MLRMILAKVKATNPPLVLIDQRRVATSFPFRASDLTSSAAREYYHNYSGPASRIEHY